MNLKISWLMLILPMWFKKSELLVDVSFNQSPVSPSSHQPPATDRDLQKDHVSPAYHLQVANV